MSTRLLGVLIAVLAVLGVLNFVQAMRVRFASDRESPRPDKTVVEDRSGMAMQDGVYLDRTFPVSEGQQLVVEVQHADIGILTDAHDEAHLTVRVKAPSESRAREVFDHMRFEAFQDGDRVVLRSKAQDDWDFNGRFSITVLARIPGRFDVDLTSTHGDVTMESIDGAVRLNTTHGDVEVADITGPTISLESTHGDVCAESFDTDELTVRTTHGDICVGAVRTRHFDVMTTHSDIQVSGIEGSGDLQTTHGDVSVTIVRQDGVRIRTTHGDVEIALPDDAAATVNLRGERVKLSNAFSFEGVRETEQAKGLLNGGGPELAVSTTFGDVTVHND